MQDRTTSEPFHLELMPVHPKQSPVVGVFFWNQLSLLLVGADFVIVQATDENEDVSNSQQTSRRESGPGVSLLAQPAKNGIHEGVF